MTEAVFASLNPALLARKGGAKPAMRPQLAPLPSDPVLLGDDALEDLGWNDMGGDPMSDASAAPLIAIRPAAANEDLIEVESPVVRRQQRDLANRVLADAAMPASVQDGPASASNAAAKDSAASNSRAKRAAFTLRLDPDRHLKLRLAATIRDVSAQALVTEALDTMLAQFEDLDALVERMKPR